MTETDSGPAGEAPAPAGHRPFYRRLLDQRAKPLPRRTQLVVTLLLVVFLIVASVWAWRAARVSFSRIDWVALAIAFVIGSPATLVLKMLEYDAAARLIGSRAGLRRALEVAVVSSAANLLPLPGSMLVTTRSLSEQGATYGSAAVASAIPGLAWLALAAIIGGVSIMIAGSAFIGLAIFVAGIAGFLGAGALFRRTAPPYGRIGLATRIVVVESSWILLSGLRLWLILRAISVTATPAQVLALALAGAMSVAIGFFPSGLGAREALIALLSPIIKLPLSEGVVLGVIDRVLWISFLALAAVGLALTRSRSTLAVEVVDVIEGHSPG